MKTVVFPYSVGFGDGDYSECEVKVEITDDEYEMIKKSYVGGEHSRMYEDPALDGVCDKVQEAIEDVERENLEAFPEIAEDYFSWDDDFDGEVTDEMIERYIDDLLISIGYPDGLDD